MKNTNAIHRARKQPPKHVYVYHWGRIIGAGVVFLVLGGLAGYGLSLWFDSSPKEESDMAETLPQAAVDVEDTQPRLEEELIYREIEENPRPLTHEEEDILSPPAVAEVTDSSSRSLDTQAPLVNEDITAEDNPAQQFAEKNPLEAEPPPPEMSAAATHTNEKTAEETLAKEMDIEDTESANAASPSEEMPAIPTQEELSELEAELPQNIPLEPQGESLDSADTPPAVDKLNSPFQLKELEILVPSVKRFLLAGSVSNREPEGELNEISFTADGSAAVWAYSEIIDKKGSRFKYVWLHGGNQIATVPVKVGSNRWRSFSSKVINQSMKGAWRVELQDGEGRLMASADFFLE